MCRPTTVSKLSYKSPLSHDCPFYDNHLFQVEDEENLRCTLRFHPTAKANPPQAHVTDSCEAWLWYPRRKWEGNLRAVRMWAGKKGREMAGSEARSKQERNVVRKLLTLKLSSFPVSFSVKWSAEELQEEPEGFFQHIGSPRNMRHRNLLMEQRRCRMEKHGWGRPKRKLDDASQILLGWVRWGLFKYPLHLY